MGYCSTLIVILSLLVTSSASAADPQDPLVITGASPAQFEMLTWALDLFDEMEMSLPDLRVSFHSDESGCGEIHGNFTYRRGSASINICNASRHIVVHELAHAWISHNVGYAARNGFMNELGLDGWNDHDSHWVDRGTERAANMVGVVLTWEPGALTAAEALQRLCSFETLTGRALPQAIPTGCHPG